VKRVLIFGPDVGVEFGWLLVKVIPKIRHMALNFDKTHVITSTDRMFAYKDFAKPYTEMTETFKQNMCGFHRTKITYVHPTKELCCGPAKNLFYKYGRRSNVNPCVVVHMRNKGDGREWPVKTWETFIDGLRKITKLPIYSIGTQVHRELDHNKVDRPLYGSTASILGNAKLCIGPSSGPMHLASLCGCPHVVISDSKKWNLGGKKGTNRQRYETEWNPFGTEAIVIDQYGWKPNPDIVLGEVKKFLERK